MYILNYHVDVIALGCFLYFPDYMEFCSNEMCRFFVISLNISAHIFSKLSVTWVFFSMT